MMMCAPQQAIPPAMACDEEDCKPVSSDFKEQMVLCLEGEDCRIDELRSGANEGVLLRRWSEEGDEGSFKSIPAFTVVKR